MAYIESFNAAGNKPYKLAINQFADQTNDDFKASRNGLKRLQYGVTKTSSTTTTISSFKYENVNDIPATMDWRERGALLQLRTKGNVVR